VVPRDQCRTPHSRRLRPGLAEPGPGWHGFPHPLEPERAKEVAKIIDLLGAGEKLPQHHGPLGRDAPKVVLRARALGTGMLPGGANRCGMRDARCEMRDARCEMRDLPSPIPHLASRPLRALLESDPPVH